MMPSPFPGMDPYLEDTTVWPGVHTCLLVSIMAALNRCLPDGYVAEIDVYIWAVERPDDIAEIPRRKPDTTVRREPSKREGKAMSAVGGVLAPPTLLTRMPERDVRQTRRVRILTAGRAEVVTVIEVLSPSNKRPGADRATYLTKRSEYFASRANFVEIDLLREGDRMPMGDPHPPNADYYAFVSPAERRTQAQVWAWTVRDPIPVLPIPLRPSTERVPLDLRACLDRVYEDARYDAAINYRTPTTPALRTPDAVWAVDLIQRSNRKKSRGTP